MGGEKYSAEFKDGAIKQVTERCYPASVVAERLGASRESMYQWLKAAEVSGHKVQETKDNEKKDREIASLKAQVKRLEEERDILKKSRGVLCQRIPVRYAFIKEHDSEAHVRTMCRVLKVC